MRSHLDTPQSFLALQQAIKTGWCCANIVRKEISFSPFILDTFGLENHTLSLEEFMNLLPPDSLEDTRSLLKEFMLYPDNYNEFFMLRGPEGYLKVRIRADKKWINPSGETCIKGTLEILDSTRMAEYEIPQATLFLDRFLSWQRSFTRILPGLSDPADEYEVVPHLLDLLRKNFGAEYVHIYSLDLELQRYSCIYESVADPLHSLKNSYNIKNCITGVG